MISIWYMNEWMKEMFDLMMHSTHFIYGYMASDIWLSTILIVRTETRCSHIGYSYRLTARVLLYAPSHRQDNTYHGLCYTSRGALAGTRNSSMGILFGVLISIWYMYHDQYLIYLSWSISDIRVMISIWYMNEWMKEMFYLTTHSTHFIYGYMASDIWLSTILIVRKETRCRHLDYSYRLTARVLLYAPVHRQDNTYHSLCYTSRAALAGTI